MFIEKTQQSWRGLKANQAARSVRSISIKDLLFLYILWPHYELFRTKKIYDLRNIYSAIYWNFEAREESLEQ